MDRSFPPSFLPPPHPQLFIVKFLSFHPLPTSFPGVKRRPPGRCLYPPLTRLRCSSMRTAPHDYVCFRSRTGAPHPFPPPKLHPGSCWTVGFARCGSLYVSMSLTLLPRVLLQILAPSGPCYCYQVAFCEKVRGQGVSTPWQLLTLTLTPLATWTCRRHSGYLVPPRVP